MGRKANDDEPDRPTLPTPAGQNDAPDPAPGPTPPAGSSPAPDDESAAEAKRRAALCEEIRAGWKRALGH